METEHKNNNKPVSPHSNQRFRWIAEQLTVLAIAHGGDPLTPERLKIYVNDLSDLPEEKLEPAFLRARRKLTFFPKIAELREFAGADTQGDGRPGPEEAWGMCPRSEDCSVVWTEEMAQAFDTARKLLAEGDPIAARMAFKEKYQTLVTAARAEGRPVSWVVSLGFDKADRVRALAEAVKARRINVEAAMSLLNAEQQDQFALALPAPMQKLLKGEIKETRQLDQLSGLQRVLAGLAEAKQLPTEITIGRIRLYEQSAEERAAHAKRVRSQAANIKKVRGEK